MPSFQRSGATFDTLVSETGISSALTGRKFGFAKASSDIDAAIDSDSEIVIIATQHDSHAKLMVKALHPGKKVFVESLTGTTRRSANGD
ncbi:hypothetical protein OAM69_06115 [bacterium]|nr:hypothetical protein [bacterium]